MNFVKTGDGDSSSCRSTAKEALRSPRTDALIVADNGIKE
jgi:hypothetical protein